MFMSDLPSPGNAHEQNNVIHLPVPEDDGRFPYSSLSGTVLPFRGTERFTKSVEDIDRLYSSEGFNFAMTEWQITYDRIGLDQLYGNSLSQAVANETDYELQLQIIKAMYEPECHLAPTATSDGDLVDFHLVKAQQDLNVVEGSRVYVGCREVTEDGTYEYRPDGAFDEAALIATALAWADLRIAGYQIDVS